jgi:enoyl-CoA hydratase
MSEILVDRSRSGIGIVTIARPARRNALNATAWRGVGEAFTAFTRAGDVRLGILTGAAGHFSAGDDVKDFAAIRHDAGAEAAYTAQIRATYAAILDAPFPVVAAIEGVCVGGACSLALCCDFRVARRGARFGIPPAKLGLIYPADHIQRLVALVGPAATRRWLYSGEFFDATRRRRPASSIAWSTASPSRRRSSSPRRCSTRRRSRSPAPSSRSTPR